MADFNWGISILIAIVIGLIISLIIVLILKGKHKSVRAKTEANNYIIDGSFKLTGSNETFLYANVTHTPIPQDDNKGSGGR